MSFPRYQEYKDSGVEWLGEVPGHWEIDRLKRSTVSSKNGVWGDEAKQDANDIPCVRVADFDRQGLRVELDEPTIRNILDSERVGRILVQGDLLLEKSGGGEGQPVGCVVLYDDPLPAVCSNFVARVQTAPDMDSSFWRYVHAAAYAVRLNTRSIKQTSGIQNLDASQYFDERAGFPPLPEQTQIAAFLDRETAKIDALVAEQRRLMALLKEKRQAVISHAVTRGLNPDVPMKPSGIEWLGDMPEHWEVMVIKRFSTLHRGHDLTDAERTDGTYPVVTSSGINGTHGSFMAFGPGVVTGRYGSTGKLFYIEDNFWPHNTSLYVSNFHGNNVRFVWYSLQTVDFAAHSAKAAVPGIDRNDIHVLPVVVPPKDEQATIVAFLESELAKLDTLTTEAQLAIDLLQERRTALISAAVTGQIDVRCVLQ